MVGENILGVFLAVPRVVGGNILGVFLSVPRVVGENILGVFLAVPRVVGENILDVFLAVIRNPQKCPRILSDPIPIRKIPGTFVRRSQKVVGHFFEDTYVQNISPYHRGDS